MNIDKLVDSIIANLRPAIEKAVKDAYEKGGADMRGRILKAASLPAHLAATTGTTAPVPILESQERAPRGLVGRLIGNVLREQDGLKAAEIEQRVVQRENRIAAKSVGNELRRFKNDKYRQDDRRRWFLIRDDAEKETAGDRDTDTPAASSNSNQGGSYETALA